MRDDVDKNLCLIEINEILSQGLKILLIIPFALAEMIVSLISSSIVFKFCDEAHLLSRRGVLSFKE